MKRTLKLEHDFPHRDDIPKRLFKVFDTKQRAQEFVDGHVWFRSLPSMRNIEAPGADRTEGQPSVEHGAAKVTFTDSKTGEILSVAQATSTKIGWRTTEPEKRFISCFSNFPDEPSNSKFGDYVVEIFNPAKMIENWIEAVPYLEFGRIKYFDPKQHDAIKTGNLPPWHLKEIGFVDECEFRISFELGNLNEILESADKPEGFPETDFIANLEGLTYSFGPNIECARLFNSDSD